MPPRLNSRHIFSRGFKDLDGEHPEALQLTERVPFGFQAFPDNRQHVVADTDTLGRLAARYFASIPNAASLWWVIADFQPDPIHDPTIKLESGSVLVIPSVRTVLESVFNENRRLESAL